MEIFGINILQAISNPAGAAIGLVGGIVAWPLYMAIVGLFKPKKLIKMVFGYGLNFILIIDNFIIDKIPFKKVKAHLTNEIVNGLKETREDLFPKIEDKIKD